MLTLSLFQIEPLDTERLMDLGRRTLFFIGDTPINIGSVVIFFVILTIAYVVSKLLQRGLGRFFNRRGLEEGVQYALNRLLHYAILAMGMMLALQNLGISIAALAGLGAILAIGIGFGLQNIAQNFVSGLILLLERPVKKGDFVEVAGTRGTVRSIHARATVITTLDNVDILVPNGEFITESVVNQTYRDRQLRIRISVGVAYGSDTDLVRRTLLRVAGEHPAVVRKTDAVVFFEDFGDSSLDFSLTAWIDNPQSQRRVASDLRFAIDQAFREEGIEIPFPQRDLHLKSGSKALREQGTGNREQ